MVVLSVRVDVVDGVVVRAAARPVRDERDGQVEPVPDRAEENRVRQLELLGERQGAQEARGAEGGAGEEARAVGGVLADGGAEAVEARLGRGVLEVHLPGPALRVAELVDVLGGQDLPEARAAVCERLAQRVGGLSPRLTHGGKGRVVGRGDVGGDLQVREGLAEVQLVLEPEEVRPARQVCERGGVDGGLQAEPPLAQRQLDLSARELELGLELPCGDAGAVLCGGGVPLAFRPGRAVRPERVVGSEQRREGECTSGHRRMDPATPG